MPPNSAIEHVVIMVQENHTTDNYFRGLAPWGANVATNWPIAANPLAGDLPHDMLSYFHWLSGTVSNNQHVQFDTAHVLPYYLYLAITGAFLENHCAGFGTNSTANHLLIVGGQSPSLRNKPSRHALPPWDTVPWDMPSLPGLAEDNGVSWRCYTDNSFGDHYPAGYYTQLHGSPNLRISKDFITDVHAGRLPMLSMLWHSSKPRPLDEHPPADVSLGMKAIWQAVDAVVRAGKWDQTVFMLTYDDWGGFDDHVKTPVVEYTPDNVQLAYGPRVPLLMFGGRVRPGIDNRWCSHVSIPKTAMQLLGLPALGVPRVDNDGGLGDLVDRSNAAMINPVPPAFNAPIILPSPPNPQPPAQPLPPLPISPPVPVGPVLLRNGQQLPAPFDVKLPQQRNPPANY